MPRTLIAVLMAVLTLSTPTAFGQILGKSDQPKAVEPGLPQTDEAIEAEIARLQELYDSTRQNYQSAKEASLQSEPADQAGITADDLAVRARFLHRKVRAYQQHLDAYRSLQEIRRAARDLSVEVEGWKGFKEPPPYPVSLVDELRGAAYTEKLKIREIGVGRSIVEGDLEDARELVKKSEEELRKAIEGLEAATTIEDKVRTKRQKDISQLKNEASSAESLATETRRRILEEELALHNQKLAFLERKLQTAATSALFTKNELDAKLSAIAEMRQSTEKELEKANRDELRAQEALQDAREALRRALEHSAGATQDSQRNGDEIPRLQKAVEVKEAWAETTSEISEGLRVFINGYDSEQTMWQDRYRLYRTHDEAEFKKMLAQIDLVMSRIVDYRFHFESRLELSQNLLIGQQNKLASLAPDDPERAFAHETLEAYSKRVKFLERTLARADELKRLLEGWREEIEWRRQEMPAWERVKNSMADVYGQAKDIWSYELFTAEDTIIIDGQPITELRSVTVSKVVRALLILVIGLWLSSKLARGVRYFSTRKFKVDQSVAELIEKAFRLVVFLCVVFFALVTVKIPLTVFAFLGGALAIGVGFGAQNLINNFISGIILLFERPIKVGDIVELEGTRGRVVSIGGRCSQVKRFDGIDILVPNSSFLEKNVVNWTLTDELVRLTVTVGVAYGSPTREVSRIIGEATAEHGKILNNPEPVILFEDFGDSALIFTVYFWTYCVSYMDYRIVGSDLRHMIDKRLREAGITIAFPQRDVHLDSVRPIQVEITEPRKADSPEKKMPD